MVTSSNPLEENFSLVRQRIREAEQRFSREPGSVELLAVSKTFPAEALRRAAELDQRSFGENYLQEALEKQQVLADLALCWHFIGPLQSNKSRAVAENFDWLHSLDRLKLAQRLSKQRPEGLTPLNVCLQVNISGEESKSGLVPDKLIEVASGVASLPGLKLRGLMALPAPSDDFNEQRRAFAAVRKCYEDLCHAGFELDTLSMGMSGDLEAAVAEGATIVRIGSALFGQRSYKK